MFTDSAITTLQINAIVLKISVGLCWVGLVFVFQLFLKYEGKRIHLPKREGKTTHLPGNVHIHYIQFIYS